MNLENIKIRKLEYRDLNRSYYELLNNISNYKIEIEGILQEKKKLFWENLNDNNIILVMTYEKQIIGTGNLLIQNKVIHNFSKIGHIEDIVIDSKFRKLGLGKKLLTEMIKYAEMLGCYKCILNCNENKKQFYENCGLIHKEICMTIYLEQK